jgi:hypothetical protein
MNFHQEDRRPSRRRVFRESHGSSRMNQHAVKTEAHAPDRGLPVLGAEAQRHLGVTLRSVYERTSDGEPIPFDQVELLLRLRRRERELQRAR